MNGRRAIAGLCMLCALLVSAFAAQSASAISGTTAFTCVFDQSGKDRRGEHCLSEGTATPGYGHVSIGQDTTTEVTGTNAKTANNTTAASTWRLKTTIAGVPVELGATEVSATGWMTNAVAPNGEHYAHGEGTVTFNGVQVTAPAGRGCKVYTDNENTTKGEEGVIHTRPLTATTKEQGHFLKVQPVEGETLARFFITCEEGKKIPAIEGTKECKGSVNGVPNGATIEFTHVATTTQNTLKCNGTKAGIEGGLTLSGRHPNQGGGPYTPLAATTVTT